MSKPERQVAFAWARELVEAAEPRPAPFVRGCDTSESAAESVEDDAGTLRVMVLDFVRRSGPRGATCDEVEVALEMRHQTASARIRELSKAEQIFDTGDRRETRSGRNARVYVARTPLEFPPFKQQFKS